MQDCMTTVYRALMLAEKGPRGRELLLLLRTVFIINIIRWLPSCRASDQSLLSTGRTHTLYPLRAVTRLTSDGGAGYRDRGVGQFDQLVVDAISLLAEP